MNNRLSQYSKKVFQRILNKQCALPVITTMALWKLMHLGTNIYICIYMFTYICIYIYIYDICEQYADDIATYSF